ncbi:Roundabout 2 [Orchesella cincta]|uniref:Roundabout 2 n=1 Tax=Orchesella cincta TaxID=48709 RepID=A0A1D2MME4_ORCCI|nr:Roundabout 2 [Orchesella cincta]
MNSADGSKSMRVTISANGTLQISDLRATDTGQYTCVASSVSGETSATASLAVESPVNPNIAFHRTNPSLLPPPPSQPVVVNETQATSITLSWTWNPNKAVMPRSQPLLGFTIESYSPDLQSGWLTLGHRIYSGTRPGEVIVHTVDGLKPDTTYLFVVRAENPEGFSAPSFISDPIRTKHGTRRSSDVEEVDEEEARNQLSGSDIELISAEPASSTSIRISWKVSKASMRFIDGYYIRYRDISPDQPLKGFNVLTVVAQKNHFDAYAHVIPNLKKYTMYEIFVGPFYKNVEGQPSNSKMISTLEDKPSAPPKNLVFKMMNSTAGSVRWSPLESQQHNGILRGFRVEIRGNDSRLHAEMDFGPNITSIVLSNLTLGRSYFVRVCGYTSVGFGPYSQPLKIEMDPALLSPSGAEQNGVTAEDGNAAQILKEVWFIILMGCLLFILLLFLVIILYTRRKSHGKKDHISSVMVAPHTDSQFVSGKQSLWIDQRWRPTDASDKDSNRSEAKLLANHHLVNGELGETTDYAEVDPQNLTTFYNTSNKGLSLHPHPQTLLQLQQQQMQAQQQPDLTPYATTTLIQQRRPNYDPLPSNPISLTKNMLNDSRDRESDQFSSGRSKLSIGSNNFNKFKSAHASPSPSPSAPLKMMPMSSRMGCYPSPGPNRSHLVPLEHQAAMPSLHHPYHNAHHANENLYHIGEIFNPNKSASVTNGFEAVYQSGDPEDNDPNVYTRSPYSSDVNGFQKLGRFQRPTVSQSHLDNDYHDWQHDPSAIKLAKTLKESNA